MDHEEVLDEVSGHLNAQHARLVDVTIAMLDDRRWWSGPGVETPERYLRWRAALSPERASQIVTIARRAGDLPSCMARFRAGELSVDQMAALAKRAPWWTDEQNAGLAPKLTVSQLRRLLSSYPFPSIAKPDEHHDDSHGTSAHDESPAGAGGVDDGDDADDADAGAAIADDAETGSPTAGPSLGEQPADGGRQIDERVWFGWGDDGMFRLSVSVGADDGLVIEAALREARDRLFKETRGEVTWAAALRNVADRSLDQIEGTARRDRYRINVHIDTDGDFTDATGKWLPDAIRRHIGCDGRLSPVFYAKGAAIKIGRTDRIVPPRIRRQVIRRDHGACRVPGCGSDVFVEIHHIVHWEDDGVTETWNLICLCPMHHRMHHRGELGIAGDADVPDGVSFTNRHGLVIAASGARPEPPGASPPRPSGDYRHPLGERLDSQWFEYREPRPPTAA